jgi:hypothetical protein
VPADEAANRAAKPTNIGRHNRRDGRLNLRPQVANWPRQRLVMRRSRVRFSLGGSAGQGASPAIFAEVSPVIWGHRADTPLAQCPEPTLIHRHRPLAATGCPVAPSLTAAVQIAKNMTDQGVDARPSR